jgi:hypothetical protein
MQMLLLGACDPLDTRARGASENLRVVRNLLAKGDATPTDVVAVAFRLIGAAPST